MIHVLLVLLLSSLFIVENIFVMYGASLLDSGIFVPHFLLMVILFIGVYYDYSKAMMYGFLFGLLYDVVFTEVLGVYSFAFLFAVILFKLVMRLLQSNLFIISFLSIFFVLVLEFYVYALLKLFGSVEMTVTLFWDERVLPTLILNTIFIILLGLPLKKFLRYLTREFAEK